MKPDPQQHRFRRFAPGKPRPVLIAASSAVVALAAAPAATPIAQASDAADGQVVPHVESRLRPAWQALRDADCARCHGKDYDGLAAPSIVEYARLVSRDLFIRKVLDGDPPRGMPSYRGVAPIATHIDEIYRYFALDRGSDRRLPGRAEAQTPAGASVPHGLAGLIQLAPKASHSSWLLCSTTCANAVCWQRAAGPGSFEHRCTVDFEVPETLLK